MSGVVSLPPRPKRHLRSALARLLALRRRGRGRHEGAATPEVRELRVRCRRSGGRPVVEVAGRLNKHTRAPLVEALEAALEDEARQIVLDLGKLESIDAAGLDAVLTAHLRAGDQLKVLSVVPGPSPVQRVFDHAEVPLLYTSRPAARAGRVHACVAKGRSVVSWQISNTR